MNQTFRTWAFVSLFSFVFFVASSQTPFQHVQVVQGDTWTYEYNGILSQITNPLNSSLGDLSDVYVGGGQYELQLVADSNALGSDEVVVYYLQGLPPFATPNFLSFEFEIVPSIVTTERDYASAMVNELDISIFPLLNDSSTAGGLHLTQIALVNNGTAEIISGDEILFTPDFDYAGMAYIDYIVCDSLNTCANGQITVCVMPHDPEYISDTVSYSTTENNTLTILAPSSGYQVFTVPDHGTVSSVSDDAFDYVPDANFVGRDTFLLWHEDEDVTRLICIRVIELPDPNSFAVDDYVYMTVNDSITFNVFDNDLTDNYSISDFTSGVPGDLVYLGDGTFSYVAPMDFEGLIQFDHTICDFFNTACETAQVYIYIDNHAPAGDGEFVLVTPKNTPVILNYDIPILGFDFEIETNPSQGWLGYFPGAQYVILDCHEVYGYNQLVYNPEEDYVGLDSFQVSFCVNSMDTCEEIKIKIIVLDLDLDTTCPCVTNCVWPGDANGDGKVNVRDILPIGYNMGSMGPSRPEANSDEWYGQYCEDWSEDQDNGSNIKHADTDGDGILLAQDTSKIIQHYYSTHTVVPEDDDNIKAYPIQLILEDPEVEAGDWATIYVSTGTEQYPMVDYTGLTFSIDYNTDYVVDSTMSCTFYSDSWLSTNSPNLSLGVRPYAGRLEAGITRTDGLAVSGQGILARLDFIVEEDIGGFGQEGLFKLLNLRIHQIQGMQGNGSTVHIPGSAATLAIVGSSTEDDSNDFIGKPEIQIEDIILYPNPTQDQCIVHLNGAQNEFHKLEVINQQGKSILRWEGSPRKRHRIFTSDMHFGVHFVRVYSGDQVLTKKLVIL